MPYLFSTRIFVIIVCYAPILGSIFPKTSFGSNLPDLDLVRVSTILLLCSFFVESLKQGKVRINSWIVVIIVYSINVAASVSWSDSYVYDARMIASFFDALFVPFFIAFVGVNIFQDVRNRKQYARNITYSACILSVLCIYESYFNIVQYNGVTRAATTLGNPNLVAIILVLWLPVIMLSEKEGWMSRKISLIVQGVILVGIIGTVSRKGLITWFVTYILFYYFNKKKTKLIVMSILGCVGFLILLAYSQSVATRFSQKDVEYNLEAKWNMMMAGIKMFIEKPFIGHGYNGYYENFGRFFRYSWVDKYDAHNEYVTALASYGIVGFIWFLGLFIVPLLLFFKKYKYEIRARSSSLYRNYYIMGLSLIPPIMMSTFYAGALFKQPVAVITYFAQISFVVAISLNNNRRRA